MFKSGDRVVLNENTALESRYVGMSGTIVKDAPDLIDGWLVAPDHNFEGDPENWIIFTDEMDKVE